MTPRRSGKKPNAVMKPVMAWGVVERDTGDLWCGRTYATKILATGTRGSATKYWRIARVRITEVKKS